ncbi:iron-containing alcohol dehydrogenase [Proteocatella sphenisci]|uniref:iron-containing alcohol dehydrogenase n=1 Tax=Proteocatella sphenisci TaxID=181070 RepID=UPI0004B69A2D|nr:iron-containing alcohol dehydrogenase [Proteocatella sphenisci]
MHNPCRVNMIATNFFGAGAIELIAEEIIKKGLKKALVITDSFLFESKVADQICTVLAGAGVHSFIYYGVKPNPTVEIVNEALSIAREIEPDFIVALGGGSAIDTSKAVGIVLANKGKVEDYEGVNKSSKKSLPVIAVNTTAGTGSEVTTFYVITDEKRHSKMVMVDTNSAVWIAVNDTNLMISMPKSLTAATGMDAMTHALEAVLSKEATPFTDKDALWAITVIKEYLPRAVKDPNDMQAREMMAYAQYSAGLAFSNSGLGMVHAMAHSLGGFYNLPHGVCNAVLLPHVMEFNAKDEKVQQNFQKIYKALELKGASAYSPYRAVTDSVREIKRLSQEVGIPPDLSELGVREEDFDSLAKLALQDTCMPSNPVQPSLDQIKAVYAKACKKH